MKIIVVGPAYPWRGGIAHHTGLLATHLQRRHDVEIITFTRQYPAFLFPGKSQLETEERVPPVKTVQRIDSINPLNWLITGYRIRRKKPDLVIIPFSIPYFGLCFGTIAAVARRRASTRVLFLCHNVVPHERRPGDRLLTRFAFVFADFFIVQSAAVEHELLNFKPNARYAVVPHPVYEIFGSLIDKRQARKRLGVSGEKVILFFGFVRPYKGLAVLLRSMTKLNDVFLMVVGEFYESQELYRELIHQLGIADRVRIVDDYVPNDSVPLYFSAADAVVLPYLSATQSGIIQVAYQFNKPVIATRVGGLTEVVDDGRTGILVPSGDPDALADGINRFFAGGGEQKMSAEVERAKRSYSWEAMTTAIETLGGSRA